MDIRVEVLHYLNKISNEGWLSCDVEKHLMGRLVILEEDGDLDGVLDHDISVVVAEEGFNPKFELMPLEQAKTWYEDNFPEQVKEYI